jgi:hypothetical protein
MRHRRRNRNRGISNNNIYHADNNQLYTIVSAPDLGILKSLGIIENANVRKKMTYGMGGPVLLAVESSEIAISKDIAEKIYVRG